ncbi:hypothetical protein LUV28_13305 [Streptomyces sp. 8ZJF_21]|nr:hypothetical protein [Streptomyces sp. 8ZJF_21]MCD9588825.1 hypothetical protein [Streptomyces sp. 8ZJF_21]
MKSATQQRFGAFGDEAALQAVGSPFGLSAGECGDHLLAADGAGDAEFAHEALDCAAGHRMSLPVQLAPELPGTVDAVVGRVDLLDPLFELHVARRTGGGSFEAFLAGVVRGGGDLAVVPGEGSADRLDAAEAVPVLVDERYERVCGQSSSAAKKLAAALRISLARLSSAFSFSMARSTWTPWTTPAPRCVGRRRTGWELGRVVGCCAVAEDELQAPERIGRLVLAR